MAKKINGQENRGKETPTLGMHRNLEIWIFTQFRPQGAGGSTTNMKLYYL